MIDRLLVSHRFGIIRYLDFLQGITISSQHVFIGIQSLNQRYCSSFKIDILELFEFETHTFNVDSDDFSLLNI
jgi:hypothetical protein